MFGENVLVEEPTYTPVTVDTTISVNEYAVDFVAGLLGGCAGLALGHPFDTVKVRQQTSIRGCNTIFQCVQTTCKHEGVRGFFKGLAFPLASVGFLNSVFFGVYGNTLKLMSSHRHGDKYATPTYRDIFIAGGLAGAVQAIPGCPIDLVKIKMQSQAAVVSVDGHQAAQRLYAGPMDCIRTIHKEYGLRACFKGLNVMVMREVPSFAVYITSYQYMCDQMTPEGHENCSIPSMLLAGGLAGCLSWVINIPLDVIKSRIQADDLANPKYRGFVHCAKISLQEDGMRIFWRGLPITCIRAFPSNAVTFAVYSTTLAAMQKFTKRDDDN